jgi:2-polyprenyl-3-methyl-5-hydroxy-6-metoxy-1,4-benzoquinol methylase
MHTASDISETAKQLYRNQNSLGARLQILRPYICPFEELLPLVPHGSSILDVGCGAGLFLGLLSSCGTIQRGVGFDASRSAITLAQDMRSALPEQAPLQFTQIDATAAWPEGEFDVVSMIDVLHHVGPAFQLDVLSLAVSKVRPGGLFLYKDMAIHPRWRAWCNHAHDLIMARQWIHLVPFDRVRQHLTSTGMTEVMHRSAMRYWYAHEWSVFARKT